MKNNLNHALLAMNRLSEFRFGLLILLAVIIRTGPHPIGPDWIDWLREASHSFPQQSGYMSSSLLSIFLFKLVGGLGVYFWWFLHFVLTLATMTIFIRNLARNYQESYRKVLLVVASLPLFSSAFLFIGHYDVYTICVALIASLTKRKITLVSCGIVAALANPEHSALTTLCLLLLWIGTRQKRHLETFLSFGAPTIVVLFMLYFVMLSDYSATRIGGNISLVASIFLSSLGQFHLLAFSLFGVGWIWIFLGLLHQNNAFSFLWFLIPLVSCFVIVDHTRVGVAIGALPALLYITSLFDKEKFVNLPSIIFKVYFMVFLLVPSTFIDSDGSLRSPYREFLQLLT